MKRNKRVKFFEIIKNHIINNKKEYIIIVLLFIIGIFRNYYIYEYFYRKNENNRKFKLCRTFKK